MQDDSNAKNAAVVAAHKPVMSGGGSFNELVAHRVEDIALEYDLEPGPALDAVEAAYIAGLREGAVTLADIARAHDA